MADLKTRISQAIAASIESCFLNFGERADTVVTTKSIYRGNATRRYVYVSDFWVHFLALLLSEVKHLLARLVLRWGTTLESLVLFFVWSFLLIKVAS